MKIHKTTFSSHSQSDKENHAISSRDTQLMNIAFLVDVEIIQRRAFNTQNQYLAGEQEGRIIDYISNN